MGGASQFQRVQITNGKPSATEMRRSALRESGKGKRTAPSGVKKEKKAHGCPEAGSMDGTQPRRQGAAGRKDGSNRPIGKGNKHGAEAGSMAGPKGPGDVAGKAAGMNPPLTERAKTKKVRRLPQTALSQNASIPPRESRAAARTNP